MRPSIGDHMKYCTQSVRSSHRLSVPCLLFTVTRNTKTVETSNLVETWPWTRVTRDQIWGQKVKVTGNKNVKTVFAYIFVKSGTICIKQMPKIIFGPFYTFHQLKRTICRYLSGFYRAMLRRALYCYGNPSVRLSVSWSLRLEIFKNNFAIS